MAIGAHGKPIVNMMEDLISSCARSGELQRHNSLLDLKGKCDAVDLISGEGSL